jgi:hypothetical protein
MVLSMGVENRRARKRRDEEEYSDGNPDGNRPVVPFAAWRDTRHLTELYARAVRFATERTTARRALGTERQVFSPRGGGRP